MPLILLPFLSAKQTKLISDKRLNFRDCSDERGRESRFGIGVKLSGLANQHIYNLTTICKNNNNGKWDFCGLLFDDY